MPQDILPRCPGCVGFLSIFPAWFLYMNFWKCYPITFPPITFPLNHTEWQEGDHLFSPSLSPWRVDYFVVEEDSLPICAHNTYQVSAHCPLSFWDIYVTEPSELCYTNTDYIVIIFWASASAVCQALERSKYASFAYVTLASGSVTVTKQGLHNNVLS